ncbi:MAG TPA: PQQ-binding-like beta-propeller repeat protein [Jatrophihabitantaceae bacterium]|nr:PQQ-binding-like beta-propeller repeat protein [Jatrophihabitantaceae bacterium]
MPAVRALRVTARLNLDGAVYASPVVVAGRVFVATENDSVYAFDMRAAQLWKAHLGTPSPASERPCGNIDPLGITGTPVVSGGTVFAAAEYTAPVRHELVAIDAATGAVRWRRNLDLPGAAAVAMQQRAALTVADGRVWVAFGGLAGDCGDYKGRLIGVRVDGTGAPIAYTVPTQREAGIWAPPGPSVDERGRLLVSVGNGAAEGGSPYDFSDSILAISTTGRPLDSFSPSQWAQDNAGDRDLGSQGPAFVGPWVFAAGKSGIGYVLRRDRLGGIGGEVSAAPVCRSFGGTAVDGATVYVPCDDGERAVRVDASGHLAVLWHASDAIGGSPDVGGGRVWVLDTADRVLHALDPATGRSREHVAVGVTSRFATPALYGTSVFVPTLAGLTIVTTR